MCARSFPERNSRVLASPIASNFSPANYGLGRGCGVGRGLGVALGVAVAVAVGVAVGVTLGVVVGVTLGVVVAVGVAVGVAVAVGVGVGEPPPTAARISTRPQPYTLFGGPAAPHRVEEIKWAELFKASRLCVS
jgi:hypothetical protein